MQIFVYLNGKEEFSLVCLNKLIVRLRAIFHIFGINLSISNDSNDSQKRNLRWIVFMQLDRERKKISYVKRELDYCTLAMK